MIELNAKEESHSLLSTERVPHKGVDKMDYRDFGKIVWKESYFQINEWQTRLLFIDKRNGLMLNELISGMDGLKKYYKNDFRLYAQKCLDKNIKAREKEIKYFQSCLDEQKEELNNLWFLKRSL